jgi:hypothetical protein
MDSPTNGGAAARLPTGKKARGPADYAQLGEMFGCVHAAPRIPNCANEATEWTCRRCNSSFHRSYTRLRLGHGCNCISAQMMREQADALGLSPLIPAPTVPTRAHSPIVWICHARAHRVSNTSFASLKVSGGCPQCKIEDNPSDEPTTDDLPSTREAPTQEEYARLASDCCVVLDPGGEFAPRNGGGLPGSRSHPVRWLCLVCQGKFADSWENVNASGHRGCAGMTLPGSLGLGASNVRSRRPFASA